MKIDFDPEKDSANLVKHGLSLVLAEQMEWPTALVWGDIRTNYGEPRQSALGLIGDRIHFVDRADVRRVISLRKANVREVMHYAEHS